MTKRHCPVDKRLIGGPSHQIIISVAGRNSYITHDVLVGSKEAVNVSGENANGGPRMEQGKTEGIR